MSEAGRISCPEVRKMVGWLRETERWRPVPQVTNTRMAGLTLLEVALPPGKRPWRLRQGAKTLRRRNVRRVLALLELNDREMLRRCGILPVDPLPLCRAMGARLALTLLEDVSLWERRVALRGTCAGAESWALARELCPQVGLLLLDFDRGEEMLSRRLREECGAAALHLGTGPPPLLSLELASRREPAVERLKLWGEPDLLGLSLELPGLEVPEEVPKIPFFELLWETGRLKTGELTVNRP